MRLFFIVLFLLAIPPAAFAQMLDYNNPANQQKRYVPEGQYNSASSHATNNGHVTRKGSSRSYGSSDYDLNVGIEGGYRTSQLKFQIGLANIIPTVISELRWKNNNGYEVQPSIEYTQKSGSLKGLNLQASVNKSMTTSGKNQDSDYDLTGERSRSNNKADDGHAEGFSASIGYAFNFSGDRKKNLTRFTALVGYAMQNQRFVMGEGSQTVTSAGFPPLGPFADQGKSSYDTEFSMPFVGADLYTQFADVHSLKISGKVSRASYNATGHWNQRPDLAHPDSFSDNADGWAYMAGAKYGWNFYPHMQLSLAANVNYFNATDGDTTTYLADGTSSNGKLRKVRFVSTDYLAGLNYTF